MAERRIVDLTRAIADTVRGVRIRPAKTIEKDGWNASILELYSHCGTHMDAPIHFAVNEQTIDAIAVERFISKAWIVDLDGVASKTALKVAHMGNLEAKIQNGDSVLLKTGWEHHFGTTMYRDALPRITRELAKWFVAKKVNLVGVEPPSVADVNNIDEVTEIHQILMQGDVLILEGLVNLHQLKKDYVTLIALPLKYHQGDGAPARVIALEES